ncbi:cell division control protein 14 [Saitoella coloradoensis]
MSFITDNYIEFIKEKLYLASFDVIPKGAYAPNLHYFTVDKTLLYNAFHHDFGPFHLGHLYRFACLLHDILQDEETKDKILVLYSGADPRARANAAFLITAYMVIIQNWPPHLVLQPLAESASPFACFRDAGYSKSDFMLSIQDCIYGLWRAKEAGLIDIENFDLDEYERHERVEYGDFNWVSPKFVAFASPIQPGYAAGRAVRGSADQRTFNIVMDYFENHEVGLVVRLNKPLYDKREFEDRGIAHVDMYFDDGTVPELDMVKKFLILAEEMISNDKKIAVHCKAGLGRTGCLIGAYLIYKYAFTANEVIAYMRVCRPGMVVGPQQHWLHINQHHFRAWHYLGLEPKKTVSKAAIKGFATPPRNPLSDLNGTENAPPARVDNTPLPAPTPGQPRKYTARGTAGRVPSSITTQLMEAAKEEEEREAIENDKDAVTSSRSPVRRRVASAYAGVGMGDSPVRRESRRTSAESPRRVSAGRVTKPSTTSTTMALRGRGRV